MKSLILKDLYNIGHNAKSMLFILLVFAVFYIPLSGPQIYILICAVLCCMMTITTFSFDHTSNWTRYAMIMPVSKKDLVAGKFITLFIFTAGGSVFGLTAGLIGSAVTGKFSLSLTGVGEILFTALIAFAIAVIFGSMSIPLVFKFGAERARVILLIAFLVPMGICFVVYKLLAVSGVNLNEQHLFILLCCSPVFAFIWSYGMYRISCGIFARQEL